MKGKLVIIESGSDASGKATQANLLYKRLLKEKYRVLKIGFPHYESESSALVKMYLNGAFGSRPEDVNSYAASTFFAVDRFASYKTKWQSFLHSGGIIISDRYTTSNMVHQAAKFDDSRERDKFLEWLWHFEFVLLELPVPDAVFFLDVPPEYSRELLRERDKKRAGASSKKDIHERNEAYPHKCYYNALYIAEKYNWHIINCVKDKKILPIDDIHQAIYCYLLEKVLPLPN